MLIAGHVFVFGVLTLAVTTAGVRRRKEDGNDHIEAHDLRGYFVLAHNVTEAGGLPVEVEESKVKEGKKLTIDHNGSPTNNDINQIDRAVKKTVGVSSEIHRWPLYLRLLVVASILSIPLLAILVCIWMTPSESLSESIYLKTALHCGFSFTVGWLNCIMLLRYRVFATMMVGNTIFMGVAFVCNGGWKTAKAFFVPSDKVEALCPAQFESASHYMLIIFLFWAGSFVHGLLHKQYGLGSRPFAPVIACGIICVELMEYYDKVQDSSVDLYLMSPMFGMFVSICAHGGVNSVPWCATGHMTSMSFKLASWCANPSSEASKPALRTAAVNICLWISFVLGIMMGTLFHSGRTVMLNALYLTVLLIINGCVFDKKGTESLESSSMTRPESTQAVGDGSDLPS